MCNPCCLVLGCNEYEKIIATDTNTNFVCTNCNSKAYGVTMRRDVHFMFCFLKCCRLSKGPELYACSVCKAKRDGRVCIECGCMGNGGKYCSNCGKEKAFSEMRRNSKNQIDKNK